MESEKKTQTEKTQPELSDQQTFIDNVNKKDKVHGKKVTFGFVKNKRGK